jgi:hypothetical protein
MTSPDTQTIITKIYKCNKCNKLYSSYQSLWIHNKKYHVNNNIIISQKIESVTKSKSLICDYCNKTFNNRAAKSIHKKQCIKDTDKWVINQNYPLIKEKIKQLKFKENDEPTTIITFGKENINDISNKEKQAIINAGFSCLVKIIEILHLNNKYPHYQNIKIFNLKDKYAKIYDGNKKFFMTVNKSEAINSLISYRIFDLKSIYKDYQSDDNKLHQCVVKFIDKIEFYTPETEDTSISDFYKNLVNELILLIYNKTKQTS